MKLLRSLLLTAAVLLVASPVAAQTIFKFTGSDGTYSGFGTRVGPYQGRFLNADPGSPDIDIFCVDFQHTVWTGATWTARTTELADLVATPSLLSNVYGTSVDNYVKAAWLATQFSLPQYNNQTDFKAIHGAIWFLMSGPDAPTAGYVPDVRFWEVFDSDQWRSQVTLSEWTIITDVDGNRQEFLTRNVVPEPETLLLLGTGLVGLGLVFVRRRGLI